jgi:hypothetical protein|tara:strand:- start:2723 stop:3256 length:534 start_codon:yes stop_codon:yes gene_type:complete
MNVFEEQSLDAPIPGMGLTAGLGDRPWQQPPRFAKVEETVDYYIERMSTDEFTEKLISTLEMGVPVTTVADVMNITSVMEGIHSVDVGILVAPVLVEFMMFIADTADIEYNTGLEEEEGPSKAAINRALGKFKKEKAEQEKEKPDDMAAVMSMRVEQQQQEEPVAEEKPMGLMARRA